jgi:NADPH:quinone reductase-like Zn-dependent oxidoreductase
MVRPLPSHILIEKTGEGLNCNPGCCQEFICVPVAEIELCPAHLSDQEAAAVPLAALTAWRATIVKAAITAGQTVLVTGIGGGVALFCLQFAVEQGANVYVSSGSDEKIARTVRLGARGGVNYKNADWAEKLLAMLPEGKQGFDAVIDSAGGDIVGKSVGLLRTGGVISSYGMTLGPKVMFPMQAVMKNIEVCSPYLVQKLPC